MKNFKNILTNFWVAGAIVLLLTSCDLELQKEWEYVREPQGDVPTGLTALEWIQSVNQDPFFNDENDSAQFTYLLKAIERTGLEAEYSNAFDGRTFFLLRNSAWNGNNSIMQHMAGSSAYPLDSIEDDSRLVHLLKYHIIPDLSIDQGPIIPRSDAHFYYQTLVPGDTGVIELNRRLWNAQLRINTSAARIGMPSIPSNMPNTSRGTGVSLHNYRFTNGVGHQLNGYVRYQPF